MKALLSLANDNSSSQIHGAQNESIRRKSTSSKGEMRASVALLESSTQSKKDEKARRKSTSGKGDKGGASVALLMAGIDLAVAKENEIKNQKKENETEDFTIDQKGHVVTLRKREDKNRNIRRSKMYKST
ncbi:unnamed protein product, partial [Meganyctiphanes norvegica]